MSSWLVIGLGNPGAEYAKTRHNVGQMSLALLAERIHVSFSAHKARAEVAEGRLGIGIDAPKLILARPRSYMNESGGPAVALRDFFSVDAEHIIVLHDELDLPMGSIRVKRGGGDNGHNGLKSLTKSLGSADYLRVRLGIGRPPGQQDPADFVLRPFASSEKDALALLIDRGADAVESLIANGLEKTQSSFND